jgi:glutathione S-transferase
VDERLTHADIAVAATLRHFRDAMGEGWDFSRWPALAAHSAQCEALGVFQKISQQFVFTPAKG